MRVYQSASVHLLCRVEGHEVPMVIKNYSKSNLQRHPSSRCIPQHNESLVSCCWRFSNDGTHHFQYAKSPSCISYVLPFWRYLPAALTADSEPSSWRSVNDMISPHTNFCSKSLWMTPAAAGASVPFLMVHARDSSGPAVKYRMSCGIPNQSRIDLIQSHTGHTLSD